MFHVERYDEVFHVERFVVCKLYVQKCMMLFKMRGLREKRNLRMQPPARQDTKRRRGKVEENQNPIV